MTSILNRSLGSQQHGHDFKGDTFHKTLRTTMNNAKILKSTDPSPKSSNPGSSKSSSNHGSAHGSDHGSVHGSDHGSDHGSTKTPSNHGSSKASSVKASPRKPIVVGGRKPKVALPIRRSARIAAANRRRG